MLEQETAELAASFEEVALPHRNDLFRTAIFLIGRSSEAEDAVQETYLQAWKSFGRFTPGTNCRAWLYKILFHVVSHQRRKWFHRFQLQEDPNVWEETLVYEAPVRQDLSDEEILAAFQKVPQQYAQVVMLADVHEFSYKEIQETLDIPIGTVMSRLSRGRQLLRVHLAAFAPAMAARG